MLLLVLLGKKVWAAECGKFKMASFTLKMFAVDLCQVWVEVTISGIYRR